jgi:TetR/AcrR family transcriptional regulator, transcriptional repressor for nem operon
LRARDRLVLAGVDLVLVRDLAAVRPVLQHEIDFNSKENLVREALIDALGQTRAELGRVACADGAGIEGLVRTYLSPWHRDRPHRGCATASLASEIARLSRPTRVTFTEQIEALIDLIAEQLPTANQRTRRKAAIGIFSVMMGALQLARAVADKDMSDQFLQSGVDAALDLAREFNI